MNNEKPLVTVFMAAYNSQDHIRKSLESILNQTYENLEILIIDDGSIDNTVNIIKSYNDKRIRIIENKVNKGIPFTRNLGIKESKGKYMAVMDSDDISDITRIEKQVKILEEHEEIDVVASYFTVFKNDKQIDNKISLKNISKKITRYKSLNSEEIKCSLIFSCVIGNPTSMIRLDTLRNHNISYDEKCFIAQDYRMWSEISKIGRFYMIEESLLNYRDGHSNISKISRDKKYNRKIIIDNIHNDLLEFYKFELTSYEKIIFNEFFNEDCRDVLNEIDISEIKNILDKLIYQNKNNNTFNNEVFIKVINSRINEIINSNNYSFIESIRIYMYLIRVNNYKTYISDIVRIILFKFKKILK